MYNTASFLEDAKEILSDIRIQESSILEVEKTNEAEKKLHTQQEEKVRKNNLSQELQKEELTSLALYYKNLRNMIQQQDHIREINNSIKHPWDEIFKQKEALSNI